jgi:hypothetical protein
MPSKHENKTSFGEIRQNKMCISVVLYPACLPASLIMHVPISEWHAQWHWCLHLWTLNAYLNSIQRSWPSSYWWPMLILCCFFFLAESVKILAQPRVGIPLADIFSRNNRLRACVIKGQLCSYEHCRTGRNLCSRCVVRKMKENGWSFHFKLDN